MYLKKQAELSTKLHNVAIEDLSLTTQQNADVIASKYDSLQLQHARSTCKVQY